MIDYYPFGQIRFDQKQGAFSESKKFTGHEYDADTDLNYMKARYQSGRVGRFMSQDPAAKDNPRKFLDDPQQLNMYSYARNNPLRLIDPSGRTVTVYIEAGKISDGLRSILGHAFIDVNRKTYSWAPAEGTTINGSRYGDDLGIVSTDYYLQKDTKNNDSYSTYSFDTTSEQEKKIQNYYNKLAEVNTNNNNNDDVVFGNLSNNCTDIVVAALKSGGIVNNNFNLGSIQTPSNLKNRFDQKYNSQSSGGWFQGAKNWWNKKENGQIMNIDSRSSINTNLNNNKQNDKKDF